jgi:hypothetical protein
LLVRYFRWQSVLPLAVVAAWALCSNPAQAGYISTKVSPRSTSMFALEQSDSGCALSTAGALDPSEEKDAPAVWSPQSPRWAFPLWGQSNNTGAAGTSSSTTSNANPVPGLFVRPELSDAELVSRLCADYTLLHPPPQVTSIFHPPRAS